MQCRWEVHGDSLLLGWKVLNVFNVFKHQRKITDCNVAVECKTQREHQQQAYGSAEMWIPKKRPEEAIC